MFITLKTGADLLLFEESIMNWGRQLFAAASYLRWCVQKRNGTLRNLIDAASYLRWCVQKRNGTLRNLIAPPVPTVKRMGSVLAVHAT